ncbi:unnamed protein product [Nesidiocoris tenuis]|uniref:Uncharacterized protein n=1 Tax=Nesidiocoris tenuis TaxID=355587 RepID=A0A6H5GBF4_9HEMI|nr:unnamed protein product [Nesidiocoris tenuis]
MKERSESQKCRCGLVRPSATRSSPTLLYDVTVMWSFTKMAIALSILNLFSRFLNWMFVLARSITQFNRNLNYLLPVLAMHKPFKDVNAAISDLRSELSQIRIPSIIVDDPEQIIKTKELEMAAVWSRQRRQGTHSYAANRILEVSAHPAPRVRTGGRISRITTQDRPWKRTVVQTSAKADSWGAIVDMADAVVVPVVRAIQVLITTGGTIGATAAAVSTAGGTASELST